MRTAAERSAAATDSARPRRVLVIDGHPGAGSLGSALAQAVFRGAESRGGESRLRCLRDMDFDPCAYQRELEPDLRAAQEDLVWAEILVVVYPTWWGTTPALLKGFFDRVLQPGFAFAERSDGGWEGRLAGRAALLVTTMDTPHWIYRWLLGAPGDRALRDATLGFCGIAPVEILAFGPVRTSTPEERHRWLARATRAGRGLETTFRTGWRVRLRAWRAVARLHFYPQPWLAYTVGALGAASFAPGEWHWPGYLLGYAAIALIEFITVLTNERADFESDRVNRNASALTGGSRVLVEERLSAEDLRRGRRWAGLLFFIVLALALAAMPQAAVFVGLAMAGLALGLAYSVPPIRLCARGLGELDVGVTHSFLVVLGGFAAQGGAVGAAWPWALAAPLALAVLPSITLAGFPDFEADAATGKRTLAVRLGRSRATIFAGTCALLAAVLPVILSGTVRGFWWVSLAAIPHALWLVARLRRFVEKGAPAGRIDGLLVLALTFMLWFCVVPLVLLLHGRG